MIRLSGQHSHLDYSLHARPSSRSLIWDLLPAAISCLPSSMITVSSTPTLIELVPGMATTLYVSSGTVTSNDGTVTISSTDYADSRSDETLCRQHQHSIRDDFSSGYKGCITSGVIEFEPTTSLSSPVAIKTQCCTSKRGFSPEPTITSAPPPVADAALRIGTLKVPQPSPTNAALKPRGTGVIVGSLSAVIVAIATIASLAFYLTSFRKKCCGCGGGRHSHRAGRRVDLESWTKGDSPGAGGGSVVRQAPQAPRLTDGESSISRLVWVGGSSSESIPGGARREVGGRGPTSPAVFERSYQYPGYVAPPQGRPSQTARDAQPVPAPADALLRSSDHGQQAVMDVSLTVWSNRNQRQLFDGNTSSFIPAPNPPKRPYVGRTGLGVGPTSTASSTNLSYQCYSPSTAPTVLDQARRSTGTSSPSSFGVRASRSGIAQPAKAPAREAVRKPDSTTSILPTPSSSTSPGQREPQHSRQRPRLYIASSKPRQSLYTPISDVSLQTIDYTPNRGGRWTNEFRR